MLNKSWYKNSYIVLPMTSVLLKGWMKSNKLQTKHSTYTIAPFTFHCSLETIHPKLRAFKYFQICEEVGSPISFISIHDTIN